MSQQASNCSESSFESTNTELEVRNDGDDTHEAVPNEFLVEESETTFDANMVTWDGPDDPTNPQNWSTKYKWLVTVVTTVMAVNVYAY